MDRNTDLYRPQKIALSSLMNSVNYKDIIFVGGIADYLNLYGHFDIPINDLDLVFNELEDLAFVHGFFGLEITPNDTYRDLCEEHYKIDLNLKLSEVRIDFFKKEFKKEDIREGYLFNHKIQFASFEYMKNFHNSEIFRKEVKEDYSRLQKHSRKASYYNILFNKLEVEVHNGDNLIKLIKEITSNKFVITGGVADEYHINGKLDFNKSRDLDIIVQDINIFYKLVSILNLSIGTHSIFIGSTKKFNLIQAYGEKFNKRIDLYFNPNVLNTQEVENVIVSSKEQRIEDIEEFTNSLDKVLFKNKIKLKNLV